MSLPFLRTKINIPVLRRGALDRDRLMRTLDFGLDSRLILVTAPAGYGKTTLVTQWVNTQEQAVCWLTLGEAENSLAGLFNLLMAAVHEKFPEFDGIPFPANRFDADLQKELITGLINSLATLGKQLIIVLDDFHEIANPDSHIALDFMIEHLPQNVLLVMTSRERPDLSLPRWRARGWLTELSQADLKFDDDQSGRFFRETMRLPLSDEEVTWVNERVDGWVTGLQFTGLRLQKSGQAESFLELLAPDDKVDHYSADYLLSEVMERESPASQAFLIQTSILSRMNGPLCDALLDIDGGLSQIQLEEMEARNLFTLPLDHHREWFRYHPLMGDLLRARLEHSLSGEEIKRLHRRVAVWFDENGWREESIHHALAAEEYELAVQYMIPIQTMFLWEEKGVQQASVWLEKLPESYLIKYPRLGIMSIGASLVRGELNNIFELLRLLEGKEDVESEWHAIQGNLKRNAGDIDGALADLEIALESLNNDDQGWVMMVYLQTMMCYREKGRFADAKALVEDAVQLFGKNETNPPFIQIMLNWFQGLIVIVQGDFHGARRYFEDGLAMVKVAPLHQRAPRGYLLTALSDIYCLWNDLDQAEHYAKQTLEIGKRTGIGDMIVNGRINLIDVAIARRDGEGMKEQFSKLNDFLNHSQFQPFKKMFRRIELGGLLQMGDREPAIEWANQRDYFLSDELLLENRGEYALWAKTKLFQSRGQDLEDCSELLTNLADFTNRLIQLGLNGPDLYLELNARLINAETVDIIGRADEAVLQLSAACSMGLRSGVIQPFFEFQSFIARVFNRLTPSEQTFLKPVVQSEPAPTISKAHHPDLEMKVELTGRERDILLALAEGLSNKEIETRHVISRNTVRTHLRNLYSKLDVASRTQAVLKAQEMGLV